MAASSSPRSLTLASAADWKSPNGWRLKNGSSSNGSSPNSQGNSSTSPPHTSRKRLAKGWVESATCSRSIGARFTRSGRTACLVESVSWTAAGVQPASEPVPAMKLFPWSLRQVLANEVVCFSDLGQVPNEVDRRGYRAADIKSAVVVPLCIDGSVAGAVEFDTVGRARTWGPEVLHRLKVIASVFDQVLARQRRDDLLQRAVKEAERLKEQLQAENVLLRREAQERFGFAMCRRTESCPPAGARTDSAGRAD